MMQAWLEFFHDPVDLSGLAAFRVLIGCVVMVNALAYGRRAGLLLAPDGLLPFAVWSVGPDRARFSVLRWMPPCVGSVRVVVAGYGIAGLMLTLGLLTPWSAATAFVLGVSINHRNRYVLHSGDAVLRVMTFLLVFAPSGAVWSLDAALWGGADADASPWAMRLMQLQIAVVYLQTAWFKIPGATWRGGSASHYATRLLAHRRRTLPAWADSPIAHRVATYGTLGVEIAGGTLIWLDATRYPVLLGLALLHGALQWLMRMHVFQWTMLACLVLFVPGEDVARLVDWGVSLWPDALATSR